MPLLRWLLPIVAALCVLGGSVASYAAAGWTREADCCCPVKATCKCHDHETKKPDQPTMQRCSGGAKLVAPAPVIAAVPAPLEPVATVQVTAIEPAALCLLSSEPARQPEKPPF